MRHETLRCEVKLEVSDDSVGTIEGYGSVFGNVDSYGDVVAKGAFKESLKLWRTRNKLPPMLLQHGGGMFGGANDMVPIGKWDAMEEDDHGLRVKGHLIALDTDRARAVYAAIKEDTLDGLSIGFVPKQIKLGTKDSDPARTIQKVDLWEVSLVTYPANPAARVESVKSSSEYTERDLELILRDAGFTRKDAQTVITKGFRALRDSALEAAEGRLMSPKEASRYKSLFAA